MELRTPPIDDKILYYSLKNLSLSLGESGRSTLSRTVNFQPKDHPPQPLHF